MPTLVITRHQALVDFLAQEGLIQEGNYVVIPHATPAQELRERFRGIERFKVLRAEDIESARQELNRALEAIRSDGWSGWGWDTPTLDRILG